MDVEDQIHLCTSQQSLQKKFNDILNMLHREFHEVNKYAQQRKSKQLHILEVFCSSGSEIAKQANNMGYRGRRFGLEQGDLSTPAGRRELFQVVCSEKPKDIWFSPTCGPWSSWSNFNEKRSLEAYDAIHQQREQQLYQLALGIVLLRFQFANGNHIHWEQPKRSLMFSTPLLRELYSHTYCATFDMCTVGGLRDPVSNLHIQKGTNVRTTSYKMYEQLHGRNCHRNHVHQVLEGTIPWNNGSINRTEFSERYTRQFARYVTKIMVKSVFHRDPPKGFAEWNLALDATDAKRIRHGNRDSSERPAKMAKFQAAALIEPEQLPRKRRRMNEKAPHVEDMSSKDQCTKLIEAIIAEAPRVGRKILSNPDIHKLAQNLFHDKQIVRIMVAKGTDRKLAPPKDLMPMEAPFRRSIAVLRSDRSIKVEDSWESWENQPQCRLIRKFVPCFLHITVYAVNFSESDSNPQQMPNALMDQSQASERSCMTEPSAHGQQTAPPVTIEPSSNSVPNPSEETQVTNSQIDANSTSQGPRFRALPPEARQFLTKIHKNLGHPQTKVLSQILRQQGHSSEIIQGLEDMKCSVCQQHQEPKIQRPSTIKHEMDFGDKVSMDGVTWTNKTNKNFHFYWNQLPDSHGGPKQVNRQSHRTFRFRMAQLGWTTK